VTKTNLVRLYKKEKDPKVKERLLLVIRVRADKQVPFRVVKEINRSNPWASYWLKRYDKQGIEGLKDRPKSVRYPKISRQIEYRIRTVLKESNQGWTTKQVEQMIVEKTGIKYHYTHIYHVLRKWGFRQKVPRKVHVNTATRDEKEIFKKRPVRFLWISTATNRKTLP
jgi:putative transposase